MYFSNQTMVKSGAPEKMDISFLSRNIHSEFFSLSTLLKVCRVQLYSIVIQDSGIL